MKACKLHDALRRDPRRGCEAEAQIDRGDERAFLVAVGDGFPGARLRAPTAFRAASEARSALSWEVPRSGSSVMAEMSFSRSDLSLLQRVQALRMRDQPLASEPFGTKFRPMTCSSVSGLSGVSSPPQ
jgi:hypothetical protein